MVITGVGVRVQVAGKHSEVDVEVGVGVGVGVNVPTLHPQVGVMVRVAVGSVPTGVGVEVASTTVRSAPVAGRAPLKFTAPKASFPVRSVGLTKLVW